MKAWVVGSIGFLFGAVGASAAWSLVPPKPVVAVKPEPSAAPPKTDDECGRANANLIASLHECDRRLAELGEKPVEPPAPAASASGRRNRERREMTQEDWGKMAEAGVVPVRIPCIRDTPWVPNDRVVDRLGLAPSDVDVIKDAYVASNKRMIDAIRPLCATALGSNETADKVGASQCIDVINNASRKGSADDTKAALSRVAEVQAGKREAPKGDAPNISSVEKLGLVLTQEQKTFEADLAAKLGPDEAHRLASDPAMCSERKMLRAGDVDPGAFGGGGRQRGGR